MPTASPWAVARTLIFARFGAIEAQTNYVYGFVNRIGNILWSNPEHRAGTLL